MTHGRATQWLMKVYNRHRRWSLDGTWQEILGRLRAGCDEAEGKDWTLSAAPRRMSRRRGKMRLAIG